MADFDKYIEQIKNFDINDIDWDKVGVWPWPVKAMVCLLACIVIFFACHFLIVNDKNMELSLAEKNEKDLKKSFETKAFEAANLDRYRKQMEEMAGTLDALVSRLPGSIEVPELLDDLDDKVLEARLDIDSITPQKEVTTAFYIELPIQIKVTGGYHEFGTFVSGVAGMPRIVTLHNFNISQGNEQGQLKMDIVAKTYRYRSQED